MGDHRKQSGCPPGYRKPMRRVNETHLQEPISRLFCRLILV